MATINVTLNPSDMNGAWTLTNGNLTATVGTSGASTNIRATHGKLTGKWYWEVKLDSGATALVIGISNISYPITSSTWNGATGNALNFRAYLGSTGNKLPENIAYGSAWKVGDVIGVALDLDSGTLEFYKNGVSQGFSHTNLSEMGEVFPFFKDFTTTSKTFTVNFGATPFAYDIPIGYYSYDGSQYSGYNKILILSNDGTVLSLQEGSYTDDLIPVMTNYTNGIVSISASYNGTGFESWRLFDDNVSSYNNASWQTSSPTNSWVVVDFGEDKKINKYTISEFITTNATYFNRMPKEWKLLGSDSGVFGGEEQLLHHATSQIGWSSGEKREYTFNNSKSYRYYKFHFLDNNGDSYLQFGEIELMGLNPSFSKQLPSQSEQNFINHGVDKSTEIDLNTEMTNKVFIEQSSTVLGSGKVFKTTIDTSLTPIKKVEVK